MTNPQSEGRQRRRRAAIAEQVLEEEPSHPGALFVRAKIDLAEKKVDDAVASLRAAIDAGGARRVRLHFSHLASPAPVTRAHPCRSQRSPVATCSGSTPLG